MVLAGAVWMQITLLLIRFVFFKHPKFFHELLDWPELLIHSAVLRGFN